MKFMPIFRCVAKLISGFALVLVLLLAATIVAPIPASAATISFGTPTEFFSSDSGSSIISNKIDATHIIVVYVDANTSDAKAVIGTITGTSIAFGTSATIANGISLYAVTALDATHVIVGYINGSGNGTSVVGTISGTNISFGTPAAFASDNGTSVIDVVLLDSSHAFISYQDSFQHSKAVVAAISGTTISYGTVATISSSGIGAPHSSPIDSTHVFVSYYSADANGLAKVATVSGTDISFGTATNFGTSMQGITSNTKIDSTHAVILYQDSDLSSSLAAIVAVISGTSVSFGSPVLLADPVTSFVSASAGSNLVLGYREVGGSYFGAAVVGTVSGSSISFGDSARFEGTGDFAPRTISIAPLDSTYVVISYYNPNTTHLDSSVATIGGTNAAPTFTSVSNTSGYLKLGDTVTFTTVASDSDSGDTVTLYICKANDFTGSACGAGGEWGHSSAATTNPSASYAIQSSDTDGSHNYYANLIDSNGAGSADNPRSGTFLTDQTAPTVNAGSDQTTREVFTTSASASDSTAGIATYAWTKTSGVGNITFGSAGSLNTTVTADVSTTYVLRLTVTDNAGNSSYDEFTLVRPSIGNGGGSFSFVYFINASADSNGNITPKGQVSANAGGNTSFAITPNTGFQVADVLVDGVSIGAVSSYTFANIQNGHSIRVLFKAVSIGGNPDTIPAVYLFSRYLGFGDRGDDVLQLQQLMVQESLLLVAPNGYYGVNTVEAIRKFQSAHGIKAVGVVGPATQRALNILQLQKAIKFLQDQLKFL